MKQRTNGAGVPQRALLISDQSGFSRDVVARWQMQAYLPEFTALSSDVWNGASSSSFDVVIAGDVRPERSSDLLKQLNRTASPAVYLAAVGEAVHVLRRDHPRLVIVSRHDAWLDTIVLLTE